MIKYQCNTNYNTFTRGDITKKKKKAKYKLGGGNPDIKVKTLSSKLLFLHLLK